MCVFSYPIFSPLNAQLCLFRICLAVFCSLPLFDSSFVPVVGVLLILFGVESPSMVFFHQWFPTHKSFGDHPRSLYLEKVPTFPLVSNNSRSTTGYRPKVHRIHFHWCVVLLLFFECGLIWTMVCPCTSDTTTKTKT